MHHSAFCYSLTFYIINFLFIDVLLGDSIDDYLHNWLRKSCNTEVQIYS